MSAAHSLWMNPAPVRSKPFDRLVRKITGRVVFPRDTVAAVLEAHRLADPPLPSSIAGGSSALDALVLECLSKSPERRPPSAAALEARLGELAALLPWSQDDARAAAYSADDVWS